MTFNMPGMSGSAGASGEGPRRRGGLLLPTLIVLGALVLAFVIFTGFYTDWLWYQSVEMTQVFTTSLETRAILFFSFGIAMALIITLVMWWAWRTRPTFRGLTPDQASLERYRMGLDPYRKRVTIVAAAGLGLMAGLAAASEWGTFLLWRNATAFGIVDPQFGLDLSFYTFTMPFIRFLLDFGFAVTMLSLVTAVAVQFLYGGLRVQPRGDRA
ncbi:MAG: UPF0182 family protein, partial [Actinobacteria bacterium]|nr:UPF0182 family protein [Actinomycetota bacterium]